VSRAQTPTVRLFVDAVAPTAAVTDTAPSDATIPEALAPWAAWARMNDGRRVAVRAADAATPSNGVSGWSSRFPGGVALLLSGEGNTTEPVRLQLSVRVPRGLWRVDAALVRAGGDGETKPRVWRMESALLREVGTARKTVTLPPGATLVLRLTETVAAAQAAYGAAAAARDAAGTEFLRGRVGRSLAPVGAAVSSLAAATAKGDRANVARKAHRALLATAQAQAVWKNYRDAGLADHDAAFDGLTAALSEVSCAAYNLVPTQTETLAADGAARSLRVSVTNAGPRAVPLVALGLQTTQGSDGSPGSRRVFGALAPGESVAATFPRGGGGEAPVGVVQFVLAMGAATVTAVPPSP
jgi:hypothetical protein